MSPPPDLHRPERQFGLLFAGVFALVAFWPLWPPALPNLWWLAGAGAWLAAALLVPQRLRPLYRGWMAFGHALGWINSRILLGIVFFLLVTPIGLALRALGKDPLHRRRSATENYWVARDQPLDPQSLRNQF